ncbi:MAG: hypothetical protein AAGE05_10415, partial [Pseudomonadota bacterium]
VEHRIRNAEVACSSHASGTMFFLFYTKYIDTLRSRIEYSDRRVQAYSEHGAGNTEPMIIAALPGILGKAQTSRLFFMLVAIRGE